MLADRAADAGGVAEDRGRHEIDCLKIVPSHLSALLAGRGAGRCRENGLILGGETLGWELEWKICRLAPECRLFNHYGPTETTVGVLAFPVVPGRADARARTVPLGTPLANTQVYLLTPIASRRRWGAPARCTLAAREWLAGI